eukprot:102137-Pleurochrysis_carterae.AAC.1
MLPVKTLDAQASPFLMATSHQAAVAVAQVSAQRLACEPRVVKGGCALWVTLAMLAGTPYYLPASLAACKLRSYITPGAHDLRSHLRGSAALGNGSARAPTTLDAVVSSGPCPS